RPDGTMKAVSTAIIEDKTKEYRTIIFYPDGKNHREQSALDWQKTGWSLVTLTTLRIDGSIESETVRQKNGSYIRTVYTNEKLTLKIETWSADRTMVRSIFYAPDGKRVVRQTDENPNEMTVTTFNQNEKVDHIHYWTPSLEVVTAYSSEGIALVRKLWSVPFGEPEPVKRKISRIEEIQGNNGITRSYSFFLDGKTVQFYIEKKRAPTGKSITTTYLFDENGLLKHVESQDDKGMTLSQKNYKKGIKKEIPLDPDYLIYKPYKKPPSTLKSKPIPSKPHDAV
ncbi:MAG: hypothetical protein K8F91_17090, partial [Candidatus Obscuribacterales bacterium]|nr:hypothetical protein [Candidatus Obscuribacterales bacterium]